MRAVGPTGQIVAALVHFGTVGDMGSYVATGCRLQVRERRNVDLGLDETTIIGNWKFGCAF